MRRVLLVGWDGATFDLIRPFVAQGKLPNVARLMAEGVHGPLTTTVPPWTFPAWSSFMTGTNPGKHGIYDFFRPRHGTYHLEFVNGSTRKAPSFWKLLSQAGRKVISVSIPCTFPPEPVNGVMISGFDAPGLGGGGSSVDARGMYPPELCDELTRNVGPHPIDSIVYEINRGRPDLGVERSLETIRQKAATTKYLMTHKPWDCCMILFGESDGICHHYWKWCDPKSPLYSAEPAGLQDSILKIYQELDKQLGELLALAPADTTLMMMSDHGFGGVTDWVVYPNCWLREKGYLGFRSRLRRWLSRNLESLKLGAVNFLPVKFKRLLYRMGKRKLGEVESMVRYGIINWPQTTAYFDENPYYPAIWINLKGRQPQGTVEPGREYEDVRDRLIHDLQTWRHPQTGDRIVDKVLRREEVYTGPYVTDAPDLVVKWALLGGYSYAFRLSSKSKQQEWMEQLDPKAPHAFEFFTGKSGNHRDEGIFFAHGASIQANEMVRGARIIDLAPTILHLLGVRVPDDMDGRVLNEIFVDHCPPEAPAYAATVADGSAYGDGSYSSEDEEKISERLKSLGYVE